MDLHNTWWSCPNPCCGGWQWARQTSCKRCGCSAPSWVAKLVGKQAGANGGKFAANKSQAKKKKNAKRSGAPSAADGGGHAQGEAEEQLGHGESEMAEGATKEELLSKLQRLEQAQQLLLASGAEVARKEIADAITHTRLALREAEPTAKRLQSMQEGVERRRQKLVKLDEQLGENDRAMGSLEQEMQADLAKVRVQYANKRVQLQQRAEQLQSQRTALAEGLVELRQTQGVLLGQSEGPITTADLEVLGRVMGALRTKLPQYQQVWGEVQAVAAENWQGRERAVRAEAGQALEEPSGQALEEPTGQALEEPRLEPAQKRRQTGAGVYSTQEEQEDNFVETPVQPRLAEPGWADEEMEEETPQMDHARERDTSRSPRGRG
eukprot:5051837-Amphidinium_carterae.1